MILSAKINNVNEGYKDFTFKEIKYLKKIGLNDKLVGSMIDVTGKINRDKKRALENKDLLAKIQKMIDQSQKNVQASAADGGDDVDGSLVGDCVKLKAALTACKMAPSILSMACQVTARSQFECSVL